MITFCDKKLKYCTDPIRRGNPPSYVKDSGILVINQSCVWPSGIDMSKTKQHNPEDINRIDAWLREDDILINSTGTGTLGRVCHINATVEEPFFADGHITILRDSKERINLRFLFYLLSIRQEHITVECSEGATNQIELNRSLLGNLRISWPKLNYQNKIATYLDQKTGEIDRLITAKKKLLSLLNEKKQALIAHAVTRGLDPDAGLKNSGIPWLGLIPKHWQTERTKWLLPEIDERSETGEEELLSVSHLTGVTLRSEKNVNMFMAESLEGYKKCDAGDLVINTLWAWMGAMGVSRVNGVVSPAYNVYRSTEAITPDYLDLLVRMPNFVSEITRYSKGVWSSRLRLYPEGLYEAYIPVPPIEEQKRIVSELKIQLEHFTKLYEANEKTISLLQERRAALISAAITGKINQEVLDAD